MVKIAYAETFWSGSVEHFTEAFTLYVGCELEQLVIPQ